MMNPSKKIAMWACPYCIIPLKFQSCLHNVQTKEKRYQYDCESCKKKFEVMEILE